MTTVRVATLNVLWRDRMGRLDVAGRALQRVDADIILLQETSAEHAAALAERIGHEPVLVAPDARPGEVTSVPAILSRTPAVRTRLVELPLRGDRPHYACLATFGADAGGLTAVSTHLRHTNQAGRMALDARLRTWTPPMDDPGPSDPRGTDLLGTVADRMIQLEGAHAEVRRFFGTPLVFGGDLNFVPDGPEYRTILAWGLADSWRAGPRLGSPHTILEANPLIGDGPGLYSAEAATAYPGMGGGLDYTLDFLFHSRAIRAGAAWVFGRPTAGEDWPSDHLGLVVEYHA